MCFKLRKTFIQKSFEIVCMKSIWVFLRELEIINEKYYTCQVIFTSSGYRNLTELQHIMSSRVWRLSWYFQTVNRAMHKVRDLHAKSQDGDSAYTLN